MSQCEKTSFESKEKALERIQQIAASPDRGNGRKPHRAYKCEHCEKWHLTSTSKKKYKENKNKPKIRAERRYQNWISKEADYWLKRIKID